MGLGYKEVMILLGMLLVMVLIVVGIVWSAGRAGKSSTNTSTRTAAERLAELESLRNGGQITAAEYEKQRAAIVASV